MYRPESVMWLVSDVAKLSGKLLIGLSCDVQKRDCRSPTAPSVKVRAATLPTEHRGTHNRGYC
jgi:hypothetical protein